MKKQRVQVSLAPEIRERLLSLAQKLGTKESTLAAMALQIGLDSLQISMQPTYTAIVAEMIKTGRPVSLPDGTIIGAE